MALAGIGAMAAGLLLGNIYLTIAAFCVAMFGILSSLPVFWNLPTAYFGAAAAAGGIAFINSVGNISGYLAPQVTGVCVMRPAATWCRCWLRGELCWLEPG